MILYPYYIDCSGQALNLSPRGSSWARPLSDSQLRYYNRRPYYMLSCFYWWTCFKQNLRFQETVPLIWLYEISGNSKLNKKYKQHSLLSAFFSYFIVEKFIESIESGRQFRNYLNLKIIYELLPYIAFYIISHHHTHLHNFFD